MFKSMKSTLKIIIGLLSLSSILMACSRVKVTKKYYPQEEVEAKIYQSSIQASSLIIIMPPTGGSTYIDHDYAKKLAKRGFYVIRVMDWNWEETKMKDLNVHRRHILKAHNVIKSLIEEEKGFESYSIMGTSLGGIQALVSLGEIEKLKTAVIIVAAAPASEIIARSTSKSLARLREKRLKHFSYSSVAEYEQELKETDIPNALDNKNDIKNKNVLFITSKKDTVVPYKNQKATYEAIKVKRLIEYDEDHLWTIVKSWIFNKNMVLNFIEEHQ